MTAEGSKCGAVPVLYMLGGVGDDFDAYPSVRKTDEGDRTGFMDDRLCALLVRKTMGDGDVTVTFRIDARHLTAEELAVRGSVTELVESDVVVNHLMKDGVFDEGFGQVDAGIDAEDEVLVSVASKESLLAPDKGEFAEEALGMGELDGNRW